jgi:Kef-type K+ transport system membrane component KefB/Trk K+ transport system NAD-binding subunit
MDHTNEFTSLLIVLGLAFFVPLLLKKVKVLPTVVGEILAGLLFAQAGFLKPGNSPTLQLFSTIGLAFLMFLAGLEIDIPSLFKQPQGTKSGQRISLLGLILIIFTLTLVLGLGAGYLLNRLGMPGNIFLLTLIFSATSMGVVLPVLKNRGMLSSRSGQAIFLAATINDLLTVILLTIYILFYQHGLSLQILSLLLILIFFLVAARIGTRFFKLPGIVRFIDELSQATVQIKVRGALVLLLIFVVLAESLGVELILGAFLAGILIGLFKGPQDESLIHKLEAFGFGLFIPIFFIVTGANLNIQAMIDNPQNIIFLPGIFFFSIIVKLLPVLLLQSRIGWRSSFAAGFLLNTHLSIEVAIAIIGEQIGLLSPATSATIVVFAILTTITMPVLFNLIHPASPKESGQFMRVISGWNTNLARNVAGHLKSHGDLVKILKPAGASSIENGKGFESLSFEELRSSAEEIDTFLALSDNDDQNFEICKQVQKAGVSHSISLVTDSTRIEEFKDLGIQVYSPAIYRSTMITLMARNPSMIDLLSSPADERNLLEVEVRNRTLQDRRIRDLALPGDSLLISIKRGEEIIIPHGSTHLEMGDSISILADQSTIQDIMRLFH